MVSGTAKMRYVIIYVGLAFLVGMYGINRKFGFWGNFIFSILFTPLIGMILAMGSDPARDEEPGVVAD